MTYGVGTRSHNRSTEHRQLKAERTKATEAWEAMPFADTPGDRCRSNLQLSVLQRTRQV